MKSGIGLASEIARWCGEEGEIALWWLGQHGFVVKGAGGTVYVDPYLSESPRRLVAPLLTPDEVVGARAIVGTHDHIDHVDRAVWPAIATASRDALFVVPHATIGSIVDEVGVARERVRGLADGEVLDVGGGVLLHGVAAAHEVRQLDAEAGRDCFIGVVIEVDGVRVYHAGDTCRYDGLVERLRGLRPDVMLVPINGRDACRYRRGCIGNMTYQEAVDLCGEVGGALAIPTHFDMFGGNTEDPSKFLDYLAVKWPEVEGRIPKHGEVMVVRRG